MRTFASLDEMAAAAGSELGTSPWMVLEQERVNLFADATDDWQWIHVDEEKAKDGPFGRTIGHGLLTLSLVPKFLHETYEVGGVALGLNYGYDRVRFVTPVPVGGRIRGVCTLDRVDPVGDDAMQVYITTQVEIEGVEKPAAVVGSIARYFRA